MAYKPVVNTFEFDDKEVWFVEISTVFSQPREDVKLGKVKFSNDIIVATPNHQFWVVGKLNRSRGVLTDFPEIIYLPESYWYSLGKLVIGATLMRHDGVLVCVDSIQPVFVMENPDFGFVQGHALDRWWDEDSGSYIDFNGDSPRFYQNDYGALFNEEARSYPNDGEWDYPVKLRKVYNIEVADYHTYFVGTGGIWVHNNNCGGRAESAGCNEIAPHSS